MHSTTLDGWNLDTNHRKEFFHMFDVSNLLFMTFLFCSLGMELVASEKCVYELPVGTIRDIYTTDCPDFFEKSLREIKFMFCSDIVEIGILDDLFEVCFWFREENRCHDKTFDFFDSFFWVSVRFEPTTSNSCTDKLIFVVLFCEASVMKKTSKLKIFEIFPFDIFCKCEICSTFIDSECMSRIMIWVIFTFSENIENIRTSLVDELHSVQVFREYILDK